MEALDGGVAREPATEKRTYSVAVRASSERAALRVRGSAHSMRAEKAVRPGPAPEPGDGGGAARGS